MIRALMDEYGLEIDDIRYYLSFIKAQSLLTFKDDPAALVQEIWSGRLADDLYNMEERYLQSIAESIDHRHTDEASFREQLLEAFALKANRRTGQKQNTESTESFR